MVIKRNCCVRCNTSNRADKLAKDKDGRIICRDELACTKLQNAKRNLRNYLEAAGPIRGWI